MAFPSRRAQFSWFDDNVHAVPHENNSNTGGKLVSRSRRIFNAIEEIMTTKLKLSDHEREHFRDRLTTVLLLVFGMPCVSSALFAPHPSVQYWVGPWISRVAVGCWAWIAIGQYVFRDASLRSLVIRLLVVPAVALTLAGYATNVVALDTFTQLSLQDCHAFKEKHRLERAWNEARTLLTNCIDDEVALTGSPRDEVERVSVVDRCPAYDEGMLTWGKEWEYLQALEIREDCSGWCAAGQPLWHPRVDEFVDGNDRCSLVVAEAMKKEVYRTTRQVILFTVLVVVVLGFVIGTIEL